MNSPPVLPDELIVTTIDQISTENFPTNLTYVQTEKESIGHWYSWRPRRENAGNAFVYRPLSQGL
jgi:hypothetical protein